jgi:hypothetical protein
MKIAVFSESSADEAAIRIFIEGLLGRESQCAPMPPIRSRGHDAVFKYVPSVLNHLHYRTDAEALVVVVDSDRSPVHQPSHAEPGKAEEKCRLCQLLKIVADVRHDLRPRPRGRPVEIALGLAVPQVEAWYLAGRDPHVSEAAWIVGQQSGKPPYTSDSLKQSVYGTDEPLLEMETARAREEAERIVREGKLPLVEQLFPGGFGALANDVRSW